MNTLLRPKTARVPPTRRTHAPLNTLSPNSRGRLRVRFLIATLLVNVLLPAVPSRAAASSSDVPRRKRVITLRRSETSDGARFRLTSDSVLDDYKSYVEGERLFVLVPRASLSSRRGELARGRGCADVRVEQREDGLLISFRLQTGATVSVNQSFNRLDVVFNTNDEMSRPRLV